jgi:uncharacterized protein (DUF4415 family)
MTKRYNRALTPEELANIPDEDIDTSDIPEFGDDFWAKAKLTAPRMKPNINLRLDHDVVEFFKGDDPKGYTSRMAAVLTAYAQSQQDKR